jgi:hypothetical protein
MRNVLSQRDLTFRFIKWGSVLGLVLVMLLSVTAVSAQTSSSVDETGLLVINLTGEESALIACLNQQVKINGQDPGNGAFGCDQITGIQIQGGTGANEIHLGGVTTAYFPNLVDIQIDGKAGDDHITASEFKETIMGGSGDDLFVGIESEDQVDEGPGQDMFVEATQPLGPGPSIQIPENITPNPMPLAPGLINNFVGPDFLTNATNTGGFLFIPPDPIAASGPDHVVSVVNVTIQWHTKDGTMQGNQSLENFFAPLSPANFTFDPKVIYDQFEDRFVVVTLERQDTANSDPLNSSRILVAVSATSDPNGIWYFYAINSLTNISGTDTWADYPGFAVDEEAIYITNNMFPFGGGSLLGVRLWIIPKGAGSGGFYDGGVASYTISDPYAGAGSATTTQPAHIFGTAPANMGTFLVSYSGLSGGGAEFIQVVRVDDPLGTTTFTQQTINLGNIENAAVTLPNAPQNGTATLVETNDRRALHAVWRNNSLWLTTPILGSGADAGEATAYWVELNTANLATLTVNDQGSIGGEDIAADTHTFFPSVAVDPCGNAGFGFAASASTIYPGAYYTVRYASDTVGTVQSIEALAEGVDYYIRTFGGGRNRWGDYSGMSLDPDNQATFWVFNEYATTRGTPTNPGLEDGRWATQYGSFPSGIDFGDLPASYALTNFGDDGARHCIGGPYLGTTLTPDGDGQEDPDALGDTDEGVTFQPSANGASTNGGWTEGVVSAGDGGRVDIVVGGASGIVQAFIDFGSGTLTATPLLDCSTSDALTMPLSVGTHQACFDIPANTFGAPSQPIRLRLRISTSSVSGPTGLAADGEVEDYSWSFGPTAVTLNQIELAQTSGSPGWLFAWIMLLTACIFIWRKREKTAS